MSTDFGQVIDNIRQLPHWRDILCPTCQTELRAHVLQMYITCDNCGLNMKCRGFGAIGTEIQDVIDAVLNWAGTGEDFEAVMIRYRKIIADKGSE